MNETEAKNMLECLAKDERRADSLSRMIEAIDGGKNVSMHDNRNSGVELTSKELRDAICLCLKMERQRVSARIEQNRERIANWK